MSNVSSSKSAALMNPKSGPDGALDQSRVFELRIFQAARAAAIFLVALSALFAVASGNDAGDFFQIACAATALALAAGVVGGLLGFLFGIPRTLQSETTVEGRPRYLANTNLEQISDWLTKILVGITLVQIGEAGPALGRLANAVQPMLGGRRASAGFGLALCIFAAVSSFLLAYLWTRVRLRRELELADRDIESTVRMVIDERASADAVAFSLLDRQLSGENAPSEDELAQAFGKASESALVQAFQRAEDVRALTWRDPNRQADHARTIPVFRALIANDTERQFHQHFGSLGFALKDADPPDFRGAIEALSTAINIRGDARQGGFVFYEWNRAAARILDAMTADSAFLERPSQSHLRSQIEADLRVAAEFLPQRFFQQGSDDAIVAAIGKWLAVNGLDYASLRR